MREVSQRSRRIAKFMIPGLAALLLTSALAGCSTRADASYVLVYLKTGPQNANKSAEERQKIFQGHMDNIHRLADEKKLIIAGPFEALQAAKRSTSRVPIIMTPSVDPV
ncbi:MAG: hypothetical protein HY269_00335, partial [Deltaproteobacteria bacterium]|nr:hypothetical protein [Deltaproteobacteria bacterium]